MLRSPPACAIDTQHGIVPCANGKAHANVQRQQIADLQEDVNAKGSSTQRRQLIKSAAATLVALPFFDLQQVSVAWKLQRASYGLFDLHDMSFMYTIVWGG